MSTSQVAFYKNRVRKFEKIRRISDDRKTDKQNPEVTKPTLTCALLLPHTHAQTNPVRRDENLNGGDWKYGVDGQLPSFVYVW